jgi:hypothetical protein
MNHPSLSHRIIMPLRHSPFRIPYSVFPILLLSTTSAFSLDHIAFRHDNHEQRVSGRTVITAQDGGILLETRDGVLWAIQPNEIVSKSSDDVAFTPYSADEFSARMLAELPKGFEVHRTAHYLICHNTSREYSQWCGSLFERLYLAFTAYWTHKGFELHEPEYPLVAIVFADRKSYAEFAKPDLGDAGGSIIGYFNLQSNRMVMYDMTGVEALSGGRKVSISKILAQPEAERTVATVVHEATHQIAFNCGLHRRLSDCPVWFSEGIAVYFETPDVSSSKGWHNVGGVNRARLSQFQSYLRFRPTNSLRTMIADDKRFRDPKQSLDAYAEAWAMTYFLIQKYPKQYVAYLKTLSEKKPMLYDEPEARIAQFQAAFGELEKVDNEFKRYMAKVR